MAEDTRQCGAMDGWTIVVPRNFAEIDNGDSGISTLLRVEA